MTGDIPQKLGFAQTLVLPKSESPIPLGASGVFPKSRGEPGRWAARSVTDPMEGGCVTTRLDGARKLIEAHPKGFADGVNTGPEVDAFVRAALKEAKRL